MIAEDMTNRLNHWKWLMSLCYDMAEWHYHHEPNGRCCMPGGGLVTQDQWELYNFIWRNSVHRFSSLAQEYQV